MNPSENGEEDDDKSGAEGVDEEGGALDDGVASASLNATEDGADDVKECESGQAEGGIPLSVREVLERVDNDLEKRGQHTQVKVSGRVPRRTWYVAARVLKKGGKTIRAGSEKQKETREAYLNKVL